MDVQTEIQALQLQLKASADPDRAVSEKKYLKSSFQHYGVTVPALHKLAKRWVKEHRAVPIEQVLELARQLWASDWHEEKSLAVYLLVERAKDLIPTHLPQIEAMMHTVQTWAHLDEIAVNIVGTLIERHPQVLEKLPEWAQSENFWVRRTAILAQLLPFRRGEGDFELFQRIAVPMFAEGKAWSKEERFFIRKAIGWALRELSGKQPQRVYEFAAEYRDQMSGLTFKEATRKLPEEYQKRL